MTWCNDKSCLLPSSIDEAEDGVPAQTQHARQKNPTRQCPSCGHHIKCQQKAGIHTLPGLPAGVKFDPTDQELLDHLEAKARIDARDRLHPLIDEFIHTLEGDDGICYTHPEKLPGVMKDGQIRHFFHRPSKAYTTGTRKRRKVQGEAGGGGETRWHKTGKTRPVFMEGRVKGHKKILVLYTNYGKARKPEKTSWVMHQYHLGHAEEERDGEMVVSKVFYQTQPRQCGGGGSSNQTPADPQRAGLRVVAGCYDHRAFMAFDGSPAAERVHPLGFGGCHNEGESFCPSKVVAAEGTHRWQGRDGMETRAPSP